MSEWHILRHQFRNHFQRLLMMKLRSLQFANTDLKIPQREVPAWQPSWPRIYCLQHRRSVATVSGGGCRGDLSAPLIDLQRVKQLSICDAVANGVKVKDHVWSVPNCCSLCSGTLSVISSSCRRSSTFHGSANTVEDFSENWDFTYISWSLMRL